MADQETEEIKLPKKRRRRKRRIILPVLAFLAVAAFLGVFLGFNYFGERFLREYLREKIRVSSNGLYTADFKSLHVNILTGKVEVDSFELIPDTLQYRRLKAQGRIARSLYRVSFVSLIIDKVHFRQIYAGKRINFRQLAVERPVLSIVGFPDTLVAKRNKWRVIYEDLYPAVSGVFTDFHIDSVKVSHGRLLTSFHQKAGGQMTGDYEYSAALKDVSVNPFSYYNRERVFYSRDVDLIVHNFESQLADSLYSLKAEELGFSLTKSILYGRKVSLLPNFRSKKTGRIGSGDLFRIALPAFSIRGIDLYRAMTGREVQVSAVNLTDFLVQVYRNQPSPGEVVRNSKKKKITIAGLYTVIARELRFIDIDSLYLANGSVEFYAAVTDRRPELRIGKVNLELDHFRLDSLAHLDQSRIFYSKAIELDLERISLYLRDGIHSVSASAITISTRKSLIDVREASIFPDRKKNSGQPESRSNTMFVNLPRLTFTGIDLKKVFNRRILDFDRLIIGEPEISYTQFRKPKNPDPRFKQPGDFFETENDDVVYNLLKKYLFAIRGSEISISHGLARFSVDQDGRETSLATSSFDLTMEQFLIDSVHGMNEQGYFYSRDFDLGLQSVSVVSPDSLEHLTAGGVRIITRDSLIEAENIRMYHTADPVIFNARAKRKHPVTVEFSLRRLQLTGLNHKKLFLEKILKASQIVLDNPSLSLKANNSLRPQGPPEETQLLKTEKFVRAFEIGRCLVRKGAFSYDGEEDRKATYFSLKDIEFSVVDAAVVIPDKGMHNGLIRFDSLQLKVIPLRAVIADSTYALEARSLEVNSYPANILLQGVKVTPLKSWKEKPGNGSMATVTIPEIRFSGFYFDRAIFDNEWLLNGIYVENPMVSVEMRQDGTEKSATGHIDPANVITMPPFIKTISVPEISVSGASAGLIVHGPAGIRTWSLADVMLEVTRFRVDSASRANPAGAPLFNAGDITLAARGFSRISPDSMYAYSFARFGFSTGKESAFLDSVAVTPLFSRPEFSRKTGRQADQINLLIPVIELSKLDFRKLISDRQLSVSKVKIAGLKFTDYRDKRLPPETNLHPFMPGRMLDAVKFPVCIDTIAVTDGFASYEEQNGAEPGRIFFDLINASLTGFCTPFVSVDIHSTARLMGVAPVDARMHFYVGHPRDSFTVRAAIEKFDLTAINPMLSKLLPASVKRGTATSTDIFAINGNNRKATGRMSFRYENLAITLYPTGPGTWNKVEPQVLSAVANFVLADGNPNDDDKLKTGMICFERDTTKGFFNFLWKSVLSGIKSSVGVNSKYQKAMIREEKEIARKTGQQEKKNRKK
ncbi:MAG: hypothetical protein WCJ26_08805 [bacterium]